jgi:hypothetical protein
LDQWQPRQYSCIHAPQHLHPTQLKNHLFNLPKRDEPVFIHTPPGCAHPNNMLRGLIFGRLWAYLLQNTHHQDFLNMASFIARRLITNGYILEQLLPLFIEAGARLSNLIYRANPAMFTVIFIFITEYLIFLHFSVIISHMYLILRPISLISYRLHVVQFVNSRQFLYVQLVACSVP